ncbi:MAG: T9SS type A sorting domain-containing protein [Bacteroidetes bacterium]|nr:MAG: T9SS type A sorting domain-containing protein [Bacteroidota bacterium]
MKPFICFLLLSVSGMAQEFQFQLTFEDSQGNRDSLVLGYDPSASDSLNQSFGELNIIDSVRSVGLDVRVTNEWMQRKNGQTGSFHTKRKITYKSECEKPSLNIPIDILTKNWPVKVTWNKALFDTVCHQWTSFKCNNEYLPSDVLGSCAGSFFASFLNEEDSTLIGEDNIGLAYTWSGEEEHFYYSLNDQDTVSVFWLQFVYPDNSGIGELPSKKYFHVFPNPVSSILNLELDNEVSIFSSMIEVYSFEGKKVLSRPFQTELNVQQLPSGFYTVSVTDQSGKKFISRFVKE